MAMRAAALAAPGGLRRLFCTNTTKPSLSFPFIPPPQAGAQPARPMAEPNTNLFVSARVVTDRVSGYSKGFGFVKYATLEDAAKGIEGMDGKFLDGWVIFAEYARPRPPPGQPENNMPPQYGRH
ncbi:uncharacterized protein LOC107626018 isoform X2 [Arachis ipaensis]|uniref:uncharacterized protein LOC107626018 isoform X2 n=1 Tax=Arachis ipaensis TaxID=130454 RepID=UPI000A2B34A4|nr:uncharacterized protein LOC107626018 isoform X2 [Arachis ipaensis]XP_025634232.1 organelle RRM domain-containing protein 2, mitochondrial isoform X2 [Arachis hypogaea]